MSKDPYEAFLEQANAPMTSQPSTTAAVTTSETNSVTVDGNKPIPEALLKVQKELTYTSDTDSDFEPIRWNLGQNHTDIKTTIEQANYSVDLPTFVSILDSRLGTDTNVDEISWLSIEEFDPRSQYTSAISAVQDILPSPKLTSIFRQSIDQSRVAYYIVGYSKSEQSLVGLRTIAVE